MRIWVVVAVAAVMVAAPVGGADVNPADFSVSITNGIPQPAIGLPSCSPPDANGTLACTLDGTVSGTASALAGTATQLSTGRSGTLGAACDWSGTFSATGTATSLTQVAATSLSGTVTQSCSWQVTVGASTLVGTMSGSGALGLAGPTAASYDGMLDVVVAAGTGEFAGVVGGGTFEHRQDFPLPLTLRVRSLLHAADQPSSLMLTLTKGAPRALVASPGRTVSAATDSDLRVVSVPGSICSATARSGATTMSLGRATDKTGSGLVVVAPRLVSKLRKGTWTISVACTYRSGAHSGRATGGTTVTVT